MIKYKFKEKCTREIYTEDLIKYSNNIIKSTLISWSNVFINKRRCKAVGILAIFMASAPTKCVRLPHSFNKYLLK